MPNWCITNYVFSGNKHHIKSFHDNILEWTSHSYVTNGFGDKWLGNILAGAGLSEYIDGDNNLGLTLRCRGEITDIEELDEVPDFVEENSFSIQTETAWCPMAKMWQTVIDKFQYDIIFAFQAEECGCEIYEIYDPHELGSFDGENVYVDIYIDDNAEYDKYPFLEDLEECRYWDERGFNDWLKEHGFANADELINLEFESDSSIYVYHFEYIDELYE